MILRRTMDGAALSAIANLPEVRPWLGGDGPIDLGPAMLDVANIALVTDGGGFLFLGKGGGLYECHTIFAPEARRLAPKAAQEAMRYLFVETDCAEIATTVPDDNAGAMRLATNAGMRLHFRREGVWPGMDGPIGCRYLSITAMEWALASDDCLDAGKLFHDTLEAAKEAAGSPLATHPDDPAHDAVVGAAALMIRNGNAGKGVAFYNRWACVSGYAPIALLSAQPPIVDVLDAVVTPGGDFMEVLLCR